MQSAMVPLERTETLAMAWPSQAPPPDATVPPGYTVQTGVDCLAFRRVQRSIGFDVTDGAWSTLSENLVRDSMVFAWGSGSPVAVAAAEHRADRWVEIGWVAVSPAHRARGLGLAVCGALTRSLLEAGDRRLFGSTQDSRLAALKIYFTLGFHPVFRAGKGARWRDVCERLRVPFTPRQWSWPLPADDT